MRTEQNPLLGQLPEDFFKQFKSSSDFSLFIDALFKKGVESLLEGELDAHLGYDKHQKSGVGNSRNGKTAKTIKTTRGAYRIEVPGTGRVALRPSWCLSANA